MLLHVCPHAAMGMRRASEAQRLQNVLSQRECGRGGQAGRRTWHAGSGQPEGRQVSRRAFWQQAGSVQVNRAGWAWHAGCDVLHKRPTARVLAPTCLGDPLYHEGGGGLNGSRQVRSGFCFHLVSSKEPNGSRILTSPIFIEKQTKTGPTEVRSEVRAHLWRHGAFCECAFSLGKTEVSPGGTEVRERGQPLNWCDSQYFLQGASEVVSSFAARPRCQSCALKAQHKFTQK